MNIFEWMDANTEANNLLLVSLFSEKLQSNGQAQVVFSLQGLLRGLDQKISPIHERDSLFCCYIVLHYMETKAISFWKTGLLQIERGWGYLSQTWLTF